MSLDPLLHFALSNPFFHYFYLHQNIHTGMHQSNSQAQSLTDSIAFSHTGKPSVNTVRCIQLRSSTYCQAYPSVQCLCLTPTPTIQLSTAKDAPDHSIQANSRASTGLTAPPRVDEFAESYKRLKWRIQQEPVDWPEFRKQCIEVLETVDANPRGNETYTEAFTVLYSQYLENTRTANEIELDGGFALNGFFSHIVVAVEDPEASVRCSAEVAYSTARRMLRFMRKQSSPIHQRQFARFCKLYCRLYDPFSCKQVRTSTTSTSSI